MAQITANVSITLDGVMQGLGRPDEDTRGGFVHGGWGDGYQNEESMAWAAEGMSSTAAMLFGRRTYDDLMAAWAGRQGDGNPFSDYLLQVPKYVVTHEAAIQADYPNTTVLTGEAMTTVAELKQRSEETIAVLGSGELVRALHAAHLIDRYALSIHPIVMGSGQRLFTDGERQNLRLERGTVTATGLLLAQYVPA